MTELSERLIVALDVPTLDEARALVARLGDAVSFYKIGMWLFFQRGVDALIDELTAAGKHVFLDYKMYDIGETVRRGVAAAAERGVSIVTVHGDPEMLRAAVDGRGDTALKVFAISVLTSQDDAALKAMGYDRPLQEIVDLRVRAAAEAGCDGVIASAPMIRMRSVVGPAAPTSSWARRAFDWLGPISTIRNGRPRQMPPSSAAPTIWWWAAPSPAPPTRKLPRARSSG